MSHYNGDKAVWSMALPFFIEITKGGERLVV